MKTKLAHSYLGAGHTNWIKDKTGIWPCWVRASPINCKPHESQVFMSRAVWIYDAKEMYDIKYLKNLPNLEPLNKEKHFLTEITSMYHGNNDYDEVCWSSSHLAARVVHSFLTKSQIILIIFREIRIHQSIQTKSIESFWVKIWPACICKGCGRFFIPILDSFSQKNQFS